MKQSYCPKELTSHNLVLNEEQVVFICILIHITWFQMTPNINHNK